MKIQIKDVAKSLFSFCCLNELREVGIKEGDIYEVELNKRANAVDFYHNGELCMAWIDVTCIVFDDEV